MQRTKEKRQQMKLIADACISYIFTIEYRVVLERWTTSAVRTHKGCKKNNRVPGETFEMKKCKNLQQIYEMIGLLAVNSIEE